jgi:hypothetical protein
MRNLDRSRTPLNTTTSPTSLQSRRPSNDKRLAQIRVPKIFVCFALAKALELNNGDQGALVCEDSDFADTADDGETIGFDGETEVAEVFLDPYCKSAC